MNIEQAKILYVSIDDADVYDQLIRHVASWAEGECNFCCSAEELHDAIDENPGTLIPLVAVMQYCKEHKFGGDIIFSHD